MTEITNPANPSSPITAKTIADIWHVATQLNSLGWFAHQYQPNNAIAAPHLRQIRLNTTTGSV